MPFRNGNLATAAIEKRPVFDYQTLREYVAGYFCRTAEDNFGSVDLPFNGPVYFRHRHVDNCVNEVCAGADDESSIRGIHLSGKVSVDPQRRLERNFTGKLNHITDETQPIVLWNIDALVPLSCCRNCLSAHRVVPLCLFVKLFSVTLR